MLRPLILAAVLLAQAALPPVSPPMAPRVPMPMAPSGSPVDGISVTGSGYATAQATDAQVTLRMFTRNNALTLNAQTLQPIVDALVRAGADRSSIMLPPYMVGQAHTNNATIVASVHHPTQEMLQHGMVTIAGAFAANPDIVLSSAEVRLSVDDCAALERSAASSAVANARANASFIAQQIRKHVGTVLAVDARSMPMNVQPACYYAYSVGPYGPYPPQPAADMLTVRVGASVTMRFAIAP